MELSIATEMGAMVLLVFDGQTGVVRKTTEIPGSGQSDRLLSVPVDTSGTGNTHPHMRTHRHTHTHPSMHTLSHIHTHLRTLSHIHTHTREAPASLRSWQADVAPCINWQGLAGQLEEPDRQAL